MRIGGNRGVRLPDSKPAVLAHAIETPDPTEPLFLPIPEERLTAVSPGDRLKRGQFLWENASHLPVYCPADGTVLDILRLNHPLFGENCYLTLSPAAKPRRPILLPKNTPEDLAEKARAAAILDETDGIPLFSKLTALRGFGGTLVAGAVGVGSHDAAAIGVLCEDPALVLRGLQLAAGYTGAAAYGVAVTPGADGGRHVRTALRGHRFVTGRRYPVDRLAPRSCPAPVAVMGVQALAALARAEDWNEAADTCVVTVSGSAVNRPRNLRVLTGTSAHYLLHLCDGDGAEQLILGDAMTGVLCDAEDFPVSAGVTCLLGIYPQPSPKPAPCCGCGACIRVCHCGLLPCEIDRLVENRQYDRLPVLEASRCDGCGACTFICPARRDIAASVREAGQVEHTIFVDLEDAP